jgi:beta-lactamase regulating signal transducer with metallopeptidase domain
MNDLAMAVFWSAARVSVVTVGAVLAYRLAVRRGPGAAAALAAWAMGAVVLVTAAAAVPWPDERSPTCSPTVVRPRVEADETAARPASADASHTEPGTAAALGDLLRQGREGWRRLQGLRPQPQRRWPGAIAFIGLGGVTFGLARLALGLWAVHVCRRRSRPITDPDLFCLAERLRAQTGCRRVELRESPDLATAATAGWRRPFVLLPADWRCWSETERRAVLAHELAHVRRGDYVAGLLGRLGLALHFYHPLVYWLAGRLRLQQELAADAWGASLAGGRGPYVRALARLALRQTGPPVGWPARAFLPAPGTLMRRIDMLRMTDVSLARSARGVRWSVPAGLLVAATLGALALGGPTAGGSPLSTAGWKPAPGGEPAPREEPARPVFDLTYVPPGRIGVLGLRPAEAFRMPALRKYVGLANEMTRLTLRQLGLQGDFTLSVDEIEQVVGTHRLLYQPDQPEGRRHSLVSDVCMVRTVKPFDWKKQAEALGATVKEVPCEGGSYYEASKLFLPPLMLPQGLCFYMPDDRTLVINTEENLRAFIRQKPTAPPACVWAEGWAHVEHDLFAVALDARDPALVAEIKEREIKDPVDRLWVDLLTRHAPQSVFGVEGGAGLRLRALARCETEAEAETARALAVQILQYGKEQLAKAEPTNDHARKLLAILSDLAAKAVVERDGTQLRARSEAPADIAEFVTASVQAEWKPEK